LKSQRNNALLPVLLILFACTAEPILTYESETPALVLSPTHYSGIADGRARFRAIFCDRFHAIGAPEDGSPDCDDYLHRLGDEPSGVSSVAARPIPISSVRFVIVPGFMHDLLPGDMQTLGPSIDRLQTIGYRIDHLPISGGGSADHNADQIAGYFRENAFPETEKLVVLGYSKGTIDLLHFLVRYPDLALHVDAVVSLAGAVNGSPLAEVFPEYLVDLALAVGGSEPGDSAGYRDLKPSVQLPWLATHELPGHITYFSLAAFTRQENVSAILEDGYKRLAQINEKNDGQVIYYDQVLPNSTLLGYLNGDHWAVALPFTEQARAMASTLATKNVFPRDATLEAVLIYIREALQHSNKPAQR
jgi:hypothetical protein